MLPKVLRDESSIVFDDTGLSVSYTHWTLKKRSFSLTWESICQVRAVQTEPAVLELWFLTFDGQEQVTTEEMNGWDALLSCLPKYLDGFDFTTVEEVKQTINDPRVCWQCTA